MFEIGSSLREARERRGLTLADAEAETKIRSRYLAALENERFDVLPGDAYARGFLRTYAEYLDLDGDLYVDEFGERFAPPEEAMTLPPAAARVRRRSLGGIFDRRLAFAVAAVAAVAGLFWLGSNATERPSLAPLPPPRASPAARRPSPPPAAQRTRSRRGAR